MPSPEAMARIAARQRYWRQVFRANRNRFRSDMGIYAWQCGFGSSTPTAEQEQKLRGMFAADIARHAARKRP